MMDESTLYMGFKATVTARLHVSVFRWKPKQDKPKNCLHSLNAFTVQIMEYCTIFALWYYIFITDIKLENVSGHHNFKQQNKTFINSRVDSTRLLVCIISGDVSMAPVYQASNVLFGQRRHTLAYSIFFFQDKYRPLANANR